MLSLDWNKPWEEGGRENSSKRSFFKSQHHFLELPLTDTSLADESHSFFSILNLLGSLDFLKSSLRAHSLGNSATWAKIGQDFRMQWVKHIWCKRQMKYRIVQLSDAVILGKAPRSLISANWCPSLPELSLPEYWWFIQGSDPQQAKSSSNFSS